MALRHAIKRFGVPKSVYFDNGSEFLTHDIGGRGHRTRKTWNADDIPPTILQLLDITMHNAIVRNAKAKPIERTFGTLKNHISRVIETFCGGTIPCIVNCMVFTEGTDMPLIETVIIARPTRNASLYTQMVGRGLRTHEGKDALNLIDCVGITGKLDICQAPDLFGIGEIPKNIPPEKLQGKLLTEIEEMVTEELNKPAPPPDWKINVQLIKLFADNGNYDTHNVNYVVLPNGDMTCSIGEGRIFRVTAEDITGNSSAYLKHDDIIVRTVPTAPMQDILDEVHHILVCDYQQAIYLWDIPHVMRWANVPASDKQKALIQRLARKKKRKDIQVSDLSKYEASVLIGQMTG